MKGTANGRGTGTKSGREQGRGSRGAFVVGATYVGTVVGAGFASGQEVLQFFTAFGIWGAVGLLISILLFWYYGGLILRYGRELDAGSHLPVLRHAGGRWIGGFIDWAITLFLLGATAAMVSGAGSTVTEQYGWPHWLGALIMIVATVGTVLLGVEGVITSISFVAPILVTSVLALSAYTLFASPDPLQALTWPGQPALAPVPFWFVTPVLYASYNLVLAIAVLAPLGPEAKDRAALQRGALLGGLGLGLGALAIHLAVAAQMPAAARLDIPMLFVARQLPAWVAVAYSILLLAEVYTTAVGSLFGFAARFSRDEGASFRRLVLIGGAVAGIAGQFGFAQLVGTLYPVVGFAGLLMFGSLTYRSWLDRRQARLEPVDRRPFPWWPRLPESPLPEGTAASVGWLDRLASLVPLLFGIRRGNR